jgi:hypothetical protein
LKTDVDLPTAGDPEKEFDKKSVISLLEDCIKTRDEHAARYLAVAEFNERMCNGDQFIELNDDYEIASTPWNTGVAKLSRNLLRNLRLTWSSRILEDRPNVQFWPTGPGADQIKAKVAERVWEQLCQVNDFDDLCFKAAELVQPHSCVGIKTVWDPLWGPPGPDGQPTGNVRFHLVSIFDYGTDGSEDIEDSKWVFFSRFVDEWDAKTLLDVAGIDEAPSIDKYKDHWGTEKQGAKLYELWVRPNHYLFPNGLYAVVLGNHVIEARDFPYMHGELPVAVWKCGARRNSPYGSTHVDDATPIQTLINECVSALGTQARMISSIKLIAHANIVNAWEHGHQKIPVNDASMAQYARYMEPPDRVRVLVSTLDDQIEALFTVFGLNELLTGAENMKSGTAAKSIAYINKLDSMKMAGAARNLAKAILRVVKQSIKLVQQYVQDERLLQIAGSKDELPVHMFRGADIAGVDVIVQPASAVENLRASIAETANQNMQKMGPNPQLQATATTGLKDSAYTQSQQELVYAQIQQVLQGQEPQPTPDIDPQVAVDTIITVLSDIQPEQAVPLLMLLQQYKGSAAGQMQKDQADDLAIQTANGGKPL